MRAHLMSPTDESICTSKGYNKYIKTQLQVMFFRLNLLPPLITCSYSSNMSEEKSTVEVYDINAADQTAITVSEDTIKLPDHEATLPTNEVAELPTESRETGRIGECGSNAVGIYRLAYS